VTENPQHRAWRVTEPLHAMVYFVPEAAERYAGQGLTAGSGYFASRAAAFGPVGPAVVTATFYNFNPALVAKVLPAAWSVTTPEAMVAARIAAADAALTRGLGAETIASPDMAEAAALARRAAEAAAEHPHGRPLFAAHASLPWPDGRPHLLLWHAQMLLREFRGDGHVAALLAAGLSGLESIVLHTASGEIDGRFLRLTRGWSRDSWAGAAETLRSRGLLDGDQISDAGRQLRAELEETTDRLAAPAYDVLGINGCNRLAELTRPLSRTIVKAGLLNPAALLPPPRTEEPA
jgi:helix-turn-helix protein